MRSLWNDADAARLPAVLEGAGGVLYYVSVAGITGKQQATATSIADAVATLKLLLATNKRLNTAYVLKEQFEQAKKVVEARKKPKDEPKKDPPKPLDPKDVNVSTDLGVSYYYVNQPDRALAQFDEYKPENHIKLLRIHHHVHTSGIDNFFIKFDIGIFRGHFPCSL